MASSIRSHSLPTSISPVTKAITSESKIVDNVASLRLSNENKLRRSGELRNNLSLIFLSVSSALGILLMIVYIILYFLRPSTPVPLETQT